jgi:hypothetical protein
MIIKEIQLYKLKLRNTHRIIPMKKSKYMEIMEMKNITTGKQVLPLQLLSEGKRKRINLFLSQKKNENQKIHKRKNPVWMISKELLL